MTTYERGTRPVKRGRTLRERESRSAAGALVPAIVALGTFFLVPIIALVWVSLSTWSGIGPPRWTGLANYSAVLGDDGFYSAIWNSIYLSVISTVATVVIALALAVLVSDRIKGAGIYRILWFLPSVAPAAAVSVFWALSVQPSTGLVNQVLGAIGLGDAHAWLSDPNAAMLVVAFVIVWHGVGFAFLLLLGATEEIPVTVHEAASIDGASFWTRFSKITFPLIRPVLATVTLLNIVWAFNGFTFVWGITRGGPGTATEVLPVRVYQEAFLYGNFGPAAVMSIIGGIMLLIIGLVSLRLQKSTED